MTEAKRTLQSALVEALAEMPDPVKNSDNPAFKRDGIPMRYADLEATLDACKPVLAAVGIAVMQMPVSDAGGLGVHTILVGHGDTMDCGSFTLPLEAQTPQKAAGAITYARRYALTALFGLAQEDDDANGVSAPHAAPKAAPAALATENQRKAVCAKAKALGMTDKQLAASIRRDYPKKTHPDELTKAEASALMDKMQAAIDAKAEPKSADVPLSEGDAGGYWPPEDEIGAESADEVGAE